MLSNGMTMESLSIGTLGMIAESGNAALMSRNLNQAGLTFAFLMLYVDNVVMPPVMYYGQGAAKEI